MIFWPLFESAQKNELLLIDGGFCHWHLRKDGQITINEIISTKPGAGQKMLKFLIANKYAIRIVAKCPAELQANQWYKKRGFVMEGSELTRTTKRELYVWVLRLNKKGRFNLLGGV